MWLLRGAFVWLVIAGGLMVYAGVDGILEGGLPSQLLFDAIRHSLGVGVITGIILGMSLMILPEFAVARQRPNRQRELALLLAVLINASALLRVLPSLAGDAWSFDTRDTSMATAGVLAETALLVFTVYFARLVWQTRGLMRRA
jgi:glucose-6-phosphate-specific signal transduction histidine kinase